VAVDGGDVNNVQCFLEFSQLIPLYDEYMPIKMKKKDVIIGTFKITLVGGLHVQFYLINTNTTNMY
jgi:hypothetical protein